MLELESNPPPPARKHAFRLMRFFSLSSLVGLAVVTACLIWTYRELTVRHLIDHESRANVALTRAFSNTVWARYRSFVLGSAGKTRAALLADATLVRLRADVFETMSGLQIVKIKIYNLDGLTVFSTDEAQIGEDKSANPGFRAARAGIVASQITYRESVDTFEGVLNKRNLIASYIPIRSRSDGPPEGVFEVYSDVTALLHEQEVQQRQSTWIVLAALAMLYVFLFLMMRKADRIIARQEQERAAKEADVRHQAYHDALTGLPNRTSFSEQLNAAVSLATRNGHSGALMFIDLDRFKNVNDSLGHDAGDTLLKVVSARIVSCLRRSDLLFRLGGDEFTIVLPRIAAPDEAAVLARRILDAVAVPLTIHGRALHTSASIGIAIYPGEGENMEALLKNADAAMYRAKESGRGTFAFYHTELTARALQRFGLADALKQGFSEGEFCIYYQPRLDAATRRIVALEALLRWNSPSRGLVLPDEFVGVLEDTGMMIAVGEWVLRSACDQICRWQREDLPPLRVSVNISAGQFDSATFLEMVEQVLGETGIQPELVELELTESLLIGNPGSAGATISALKAMGVCIAIDGFGTGYSSLNHLRSFTVDYLKIDRSFVTGIAASAGDQAVAMAIIKLANSLGITAVAEGVENEAQATFFSEMHCGELQGFLFCRPLPADQLRPLLALQSRGLPVAGCAA